MEITQLSLYLQLSTLWTSYITWFFSFPHKFFWDSSNNSNKPLKLYNAVRKLNNWCPLFAYSQHSLISYRSLLWVKVFFPFFVLASMCIVVVFVLLIFSSHVARFMGVAFVITRRNNLILNLRHLASYNPPLQFCNDVECIWGLLWYCKVEVVGFPPR